jgi:hypothetical protein
MLEAILYIFICVLTGFCGKDSRIGFLLHSSLRLSRPRWWSCRCSSASFGS